MDDRPNTALLVIDVQNDVVEHAYRRDDVVTTIADLVKRARTATTPVIWVRHNDDGLPAHSDGWQIVPELVPTDDEPIVDKQFRSAFDDTPLEQTLADHGVGTLIVTGAQTDFCIRWTLHAALERGYHTVLVADGHTTDAQSPPEMAQGAEIIAHTNSTWGSQQTLTATATVVASTDVSF